MENTEQTDPDQNPPPINNLIETPSSDNPIHNQKRPIAFTIIGIILIIYGALGLLATLQTFGLVQELDISLSNYLRMLSWLVLISTSMAVASGIGLLVRKKFALYLLGISTSFEIFVVISIFVNPERKVSGIEEIFECLFLIVLFIIVYMNKNKFAD